MSQRKLIGIGQLGTITTPRGTEVYYWTRFDLTNPDCVAEITIERISIIRGDGITIYQGPLLHLERDKKENVSKEVPLTDPLKPHQVRSVMLRYYMKDPDTGRWLTPHEAATLMSSPYTLEVFWAGKDKGLPLTGWVWMPRQERTSDGHVAMGVGYTRMVNMEQTLE